jgi:hypothetical protein
MSQSFARRSSPRIPLEVPVYLGEGKGATRDISRTGIYFFSDGQCALGETIRFTLELSHIVPAKSLHIECQGQVVRIENHRETQGIAARIETFRYSY